MNIKPGYIILVGLAIALVFTGVGFLAGNGSAKMSFQAEAVREGHAVYRVTNEYGHTKFEWLPSHGEEKPATKPVGK